jgi:hypothetical protein
MTAEPDTEHVRALLRALGDEPAPADVVERLHRVLAAQLPDAPAVPARRRRRLRPLLAIGAPLVVAGAIAFAVVPRSGPAPAPPGATGSAVVESSASGGGAPMSALAPKAATTGATASASTVADSAAPTAALRAATTLATAARAAYAAVEDALHHSAP